MLNPGWCLDNVKNVEIGGVFDCLECISIQLQFPVKSSSAVVFLPYIASYVALCKDLFKYQQSDFLYQTAKAVILEGGTHNFTGSLVEAYMYTIYIEGEHTETCVLTTHCCQPFIDFWITLG